MHTYRNRNDELARKIASVLALAMPVAPGIAWAQAQGSLLEEIVVTAQKREESMQDVAISLAAFSGERMAQLGITNAAELVTQVPGLKVSGSGGGAANTFSIRGVTQNDFSPAQEAPVAVYVDEGYISLNSITNFSLFDLERVEVLRGPQGTLFGRNATGGLVHYITTKPSSEPAGFLDLQLGEQGRTRVEGAVGGGLSEKVSARLAGVFDKNDGVLRFGLLDKYVNGGQLAFAVVIEIIYSFQISD